MATPSIRKPMPLDRSIPALVTRDEQGRLILLAGEVADQGQVPVYVTRSVEGACSWIEMVREAIGFEQITQDDAALFTRRCARLIPLSSKKVSMLDQTVIESGMIPADTPKTRLSEIRIVHNAIDALPAGLLLNAAREDLERMRAGVLAPSSVNSRITLRSKKAAAEGAAAPAAQQEKVIRTAISNLRGVLDALEALGPTADDMSLAVRVDLSREMSGIYRRLGIIHRDIKIKSKGE